MRWGNNGETLSEMDGWKQVVAYEEYIRESSTQASVVGGNLRSI